MHHSHHITIQPWHTLASHIVLDEKWMRIRKDTVRLPSGRILDDYFVWESPDCAMIVPFTADKKFVLCEQYRYAVNKIMYQFPAGALNKDEAPLQAALRELEEETGYVSPKTSHLVTTAPYATKLTGWQYIFLAEDVALTGKKHDDDEEQIRVVLKTPDELWSMIEEGSMMIPDSLAAALLGLRRLGYGCSHKGE